MKAADLGVARDMLAYIDASPSPYHACQSAARELEAHGFHRLSEVDAWDTRAGRFYVIRGGSLMAWAVAEGHGTTTGFRVLGAHTDSPNLRVKPRPDTGKAGYRQLGVEVYGGVLLNSWLDRDLGLSGRVQLETSAGEPEERLFLIDRPVMKLPQLAIHLDREINTNGLLLNKQTHMQPVWGLGPLGERGFRDWLAEALQVEPGRILSWEAMAHDVQPSSLFGADEELVSAPRLDNLCSSFCSLRALVNAVEARDSPEFIPVITLFDHEEVGSGSATGAASPLLADLLERTIIARGGSRDDYHRSVANSVCVSLDMAHATHPNYPERHDPDHNLELNAGPVIKVNANLRYATESSTEALFELACKRADVPVQKWVMRTDMACGSTIGPITASRLGMRCVDVGNPQLGMHSSRETCGAADPDYLVRALAQILV